MAVQGIPSVPTKAYRMPDNFPSAIENFMENDFPSAVTPSPLHSPSKGEVATASGVGTVSTTLDARVLQDARKKNIIESTVKGIYAFFKLGFRSSDKSFAIERIYQRTARSVP